MSADKKRKRHSPEQIVAKLREAGVPGGVSFATKPQLARRMIGDALDAGPVPHWVLGDAAGRRLERVINSTPAPSPDRSAALPIGLSSPTSGGRGEDLDRRVVRIPLSHLRRAR